MTENEILARLNELRCKTCWHLPTDDEGCTGCMVVGPFIKRNIILNDEQWDWFVELLENPPEPTEALRELFRRHG